MMAWTLERRLLGVETMPLEAGVELAPSQAEEPSGLGLVVPRLGMAFWISSRSIASKLTPSGGIAAAAKRADG
jgi:hypothetical protein